MKPHDDPKKKSWTMTDKYTGRPMAEVTESHVHMPRKPKSGGDSKPSMAAMEPPKPVSDKEVNDENKRSRQAQARNKLKALMNDNSKVSTAESEDEMTRTSQELSGAEREEMQRKFRMRKNAVTRGGADGGPSR